MKISNLNTVKNIAAAILAGGKARRFDGIAKGNLMVSSHCSIIRHLINEIDCVGIGKKIIVANDLVPYLSYGVAIIPDFQQDLGPLAGIVSALHYYREEYQAVLVMPCDMPFINAYEIEILVNAYLSSDAPIVYACTGEQSLHPLCAIINCKIIDHIEQMLAKGERRVSVVWGEIGAKGIFFEEEKAFANINSRADFAAANLD